MNRRSFTLAMVQMRVEHGAKSNNLLRAENRIAEAASNGADVVLLPETVDLGWTFPDARSAAEPVPSGAPARALAEAAEKHHVHLCAGLTEKAGEQVFNTAVLFSPAGELLGRHRKLNELEIAHNLYDQGDRLNVVETSFGVFGLMICADAFAEDLVLTRSLGYMGADIILSPCAWAVPADHDNTTEPYGDLWERSYRPVAKAFSLWIAGVSNVGALPGGPWKGRKCIGCSMAVGPDGAVARKGPYGSDADTILYLDIQLKDRPARGCGWEAI